MHSWLQGLYSREHSSTSAKIGEVSSLPQSCPREHCHCSPGTTGKLSRYLNMGLSPKMHQLLLGHDLDTIFMGPDMTHRQEQGRGRCSPRSTGSVEALLSVAKATRDGSTCALTSPYQHSFAHLPAAPSQPRRSTALPSACQYTSLHSPHCVQSSSDLWGCSKVRHAAGQLCSSPSPGPTQMGSSQQLAYHMCWAHLCHPGSHPCHRTSRIPGYTCPHRTAPCQVYRGLWHTQLVSAGHTNTLSTGSVGPRLMGRPHRASTASWEACHHPKGSWGQGKQSTP